MAWLTLTMDRCSSRSPAPAAPGSLLPGSLLLGSLLLGSLLLANGCARSVIPNTDVEDTEENRDVIEFVEKYRRAVEALDVTKLLKLASDRYLDDNGTPIGHDDLDHDGLRESLSRWRDAVDEVRYEIRYRRVTFRPERVLVDYTYTASFRVDTAEGRRWARRLADNRLVLEPHPDTGDWRILSGM